MNDEDIINSMLHSPLKNYILPGLTSSLVGGNGFGQVRLFHASRPNQELITPHSHRYNFTCCVLSGSAINTVYKPVSSDLQGGSEFALSYLHKTPEGFVRAAEVVIDKYAMHQATYTTGEWYRMSSNEIHSIRFEEHSLVLFFEGPEVTDTSVILEPYVDGQHLKTFKVEDWMYQKE